MREHEKKGFPSYGVAGFLMGQVTEVGDWVTALYWALPKDVRQLRNPKLYTDGQGHILKYGTVARLDRNKDGRVALHERALFVWNNLDRVDPRKAIKNVAIMLAGDYAIGKVSQATSKNFRKAWRGPAKFRRPGIFIGPAI